MCDHLHFGSQFHIKRNVSTLSQLLLRSNVKIVNHLTILTYLFIMFAMIVTSWFWCERKLCNNTAPISKLSLYAHVNLCVNRCTQENGIIVIGSCNSTFSNLLSTLIIIFHGWTEALDTYVCMSLQTQTKSCGIKSVQRPVSGPKLNIQQKIVDHN